MRTQRSQAICTFVLPASKTPANQKNIILTPCNPTQRKRTKTRNEQRKSYRILIPSCWTIDIRLFDFLQKARAWSRSKSLQPITTLVLITNYTSPNYTHRLQVNTHCIENFFTVHDFWATCSCPEKNRVALKIFTVVNIHFTSRIFNNLRLPWKQSCPEIFYCMEYIFYYLGFLSN